MFLFFQKDSKSFLLDYSYKIIPKYVLNEVATYFCKVIVFYINISHVENVYYHLLYHKLTLRDAR